MQESQWKGSTRTARIVCEEIKRRYGEEEAKNYDPQTNCFTLKRWNKLGFRVKAGEKAIKSVTFVNEKVKDNNGLEKENSYCRGVNLFYIRQVSKQ